MTSPHRDHALTELYTILMIVLLICIAAIIIMSVSTGFVTSLLQKPPTFAVRAAITTPYPVKTSYACTTGQGIRLHSPVCLHQGIREEFFSLLNPLTGPKLRYLLSHHDRKSVGERGNGDHLLRRLPFLGDR